MRWGSFIIASMFLTYRRPHLRNQCLLFRAPVYPASATSQGSRHGWSPLWTLTCHIITNIRQSHFTTRGGNILTRVKIFSTAFLQKSALLWAVWAVWAWLEAGGRAPLGSALCSVVRLRGLSAPADIRNCHHSTIAILDIRTLVILSSWPRSQRARRRQGWCRQLSAVSWCWWLEWGGVVALRL